MDPRYLEAPIFNARNEEWNHDTILSYIDALFRKIDILDGWEFVSCNWIKPVKTKKEELKRHILRIAQIKIKMPQGKEETYNLQVPELVYGQYFYIGGYLKLPMFQLYDPPIIFRKDSLKLRTNTISINMNLKKGYNLQLFNKQLPLDLLLTSAHSLEEIDEFVEPYIETSPVIQAVYDKCLDTFDTTTQIERIHTIGEFFSTNNGDQKKKGNGVIFSLKMAYEVDIFNQKLFQTNSILFELLKALHDGKRSDTDLCRKRLRFSEYVLSVLVRKMYDMLITLNNSTRVKFQIPQTLLFDACNKSDIVRFSFPVNPVYELAMLMQCTLTGPGGFKKDNVPGHLRDLHESQFGRICPADTPDRSGCGVTLNMVPTIKLKDFGMFDEPSEEIVTSFPISLVPHMQNNDQTRLQMASNHIKQSILLDSAELPFDRSGTESLYHDQTTFLNKATHDGEVAHIDDNVMIVVYDDKSTDIFDVGYKSIYQGTIDLIRPKFRIGDEFKENDILCESDFLKDGELCLGQNLFVGIGIWEGFNYEDGVVLSRSVAEKKFTSLHYVDLTFQIDPSQVLLSLEDDEYLPIPKIGDTIGKGKPYARIKIIDINEGFESINIEPNELCAPIDCEVVGIEIFPNYWNKQVKEYNGFIQQTLVDQTSKFGIIESRLKNHLDIEEVNKLLKLHGLTKLDCMSRRGKYSFKGERVKGVMITIKAVYKEQIGIGDKLANRHGNKGIIALIEDDDNMPYLDDGRKMDLVINPLGIISRMNVGQLYELHMTECLYQMKQKLHKTDSIDEIRDVVVGFLNIIDKTPEKWVTQKISDKFEKTLKDENVHAAIESLYIIQPPFQSISPTDIFELIDYSGSNFKYKVFHPGGNVYIKNMLACGYLYYQKLIHRATDKINARSIGPYSKKTLQPLGGKSRLGGHRLGEMEVWALMAHGAFNLLKDFLTVQSDSPGLKNKLLADILDNPELVEDCGDVRPQSLRLFDSYLKILGLEIGFDDNDELETDTNENDSLINENIIDIDINNNI